MSDNRIVFGWIGVLNTPIEKDQREEIEEKLWMVGLGINYEGTLIWIIEKDVPLHKAYGVNTFDPEGGIKFFNTVRGFGLPVNPRSVRAFVDFWYDGSDSNRATMTVKEYNEQY